MSPSAFSRDNQRAGFPRGNGSAGDILEFTVNGSGVAKARQLRNGKNAVFVTAFNGSAYGPWLGKTFRVRR